MNRSNKRRVFAKDELRDSTKTDLRTSRNVAHFCLPPLPSFALLPPTIPNKKFLDAEGKNPFWKHKFFGFFLFLRCRKGGGGGKVACRNLSASGGHHGIRTSNFPSIVATKCLTRRASQRTTARRREQLLGVRQPFSLAMLCRPHWTQYPELQTHQEPRCLRKWRGGVRRWSQGHRKGCTQS